MCSKHVKCDAWTNIGNSVEFLNLFLELKLVLTEVTTGTFIRDVGFKNKITITVFKWNWDVKKGFAFTWMGKCCFMSATVGLPVNYRLKRNRPREQFRAVLLKWLMKIFRCHSCVSCSLIIFHCDRQWSSQHKEAERCGLTSQIQYDAPFTHPTYIYMLVLVGSTCIVSEAGISPGIYRWTQPV